MVEREADRALASIQIGRRTAVLPVPQPFNTLLWRVVAMTPSGFVEGERSLVADRGPMRFNAYRSDVAALEAARHARGRTHPGSSTMDSPKPRCATILQLSDLRMGSEPDYSFNFAVAREKTGNG